MRKATDEVEELKKNVHQVLSEYRTVRQREQEMINNNSQLESVIEEQKKKIKALEESNKMVKLADSVNKTETKEVKLKINELVREIDKCIALLNK